MYAHTSLARYYSQGYSITIQAEYALISIVPLCSLEGIPTEIPEPVCFIRVGSWIRTSITPDRVVLTE